MLYKLLRPLLFTLPAEVAHEATLHALELAAAAPGSSAALAALYTPDASDLGQSLFGLDFKHPIGLAAGLDKNGVGARLWGSMGFAAAELGTVTDLPQPGNPKPRLFRYPEAEALVNRLGFNNRGAAALADRLGSIPTSARTIPLGINLGKSRAVALEHATADYLRSLATVFVHADYLVVNVSSPNTPGLRNLQQREELDGLLEAIQAENLRLSREAGLSRRRRPLLLKIAPDLEPEDLEDIIAVAADRALDGVICTNTTRSREGVARAEGQAGGMSGAPLSSKADEVLARCARMIRAEGLPLKLVGVGGVMDAEGAIRKLRLGANLVQVYSGYVYGGPAWPAELVRGISQHLREQSCSLNEVIGADL